MAELKRILHADDDPDIREIVGMALEFFGNFDLKQCVDGPSAWAACADFKPQLLLLDYMMPAMTGPEAWQIIRQMDGLNRIPAIFLTAKAEAAISDQLLREGAASVIVKPFDPQSLVDQIMATWQRLHVAP